jgi:hypothetical protein
MSDCTERSEGRERMPGRLGMRRTPVEASRNRINSVKRLTVQQERT